jgi:DNA-directed RNA polymerase subunit RPC12/RpoP
MAGLDAGGRVECPSCGLTVLQKAMIPILGDGGSGMGYLCVACAREHVVGVAEADPDGPDAAPGAA